MSDELSPEIITEPFSAANGVKRVAALAAPMSMSQITVSLVGIVSVYFAGRMGVVELGAAALTFSFINATSFSVAAGFCGALETFFSQSFGENPESKMYGTHAQRMVVLLLVASLPLGALFAYCEPIMLTAGQSPGVSHHVALFTQFALIGLIPSMLMEVVRRYFQCQHQTLPITVATSVGAIVINPAALIILTALGAGYVALPLAWSLLQVLTLAALVAYAQHSGLAARTWSGWNNEALSNWGPMLRLGGLSFLMIVSEFVVVEVNSISAGFLDEVSLAAFSISCQLTFFTWNITSGLYLAMSVIVGSLIGAGQHVKARQYAALGTIMVICLGGFNIVWMYIFGDAIAAFFTDSVEVQEAFRPILPFAMFFHFVDAPQSNSLGILRGAGMQQRGALAVGVGFGILGIPLGWIMCFYLRWGVAMLWCGPAIGCLVGGLPLCYYSIFRTDWSKLTTASTTDGAVKTLAFEDEEVKTIHQSACEV